MYFPNEHYRSSVILPYKFSAVRVFESELHPTVFELKVCCTAAHEEKRTQAQIHEKSQEGMQRLNFWIDTILQNVIMLDVDSPVFDSIVSVADNSSLFSPGPPTDHMLVELLHSKMSAITLNMFDIHAISLTSSDTANVETSFRDVDGYHLPGIEYFEMDTLHPTPWWTRDTIEVCEFARGTVMEDELFNHFSDFFGKKEEADIIIFRAEDDEDGQV